VYEKVKDLSRKPTGRGGIAVQDQQGKILHEASDIRNRWKEYVEDLYTSEDRPQDLGESSTPENEEDSGPDILKEEVLAAIEEMRVNKSEGIDNIPAEILKSLGEKALAELVRLCQEIYRTGVWPEDFLQSILIPLKKKPNALKCEDHRTISLITHASKIVIRILTKRVQAKTEAVNGLGEDQFGFRRGRGTRDATGALRVLTERSLQHGQDICVCFVDYMRRPLIELTGGS